MSIEDAIESLNAYATDGRPTGGFVRAVLENDLMEAMRRADQTSRFILYEICKHVYNELRGDCWGSPDKVKNWIESKRQQRLAAKSSSPTGGADPAPA